MVVYDTYAWIEYFRGTDKGMKVRLLLEKGGYTPTIVLAEIARKYMREGVTLEEIKKRLQYINVKTWIVPIDLDISLKAAETYLDLLEYAKKNKLRTPSLADAIVYAIAIILDEELVTGDKLFENLPNVIYLGD